MPTIGDVLLAAAPYIVGGIIAVLGLLASRLSRQHKLLQFLGVDRQARRVIVYLSSLYIPRGCAVGFDGQPRSYQGITVPIEELSVSAPLTKALKIDPFENIPLTIRERLATRWAFFRGISVDVNASPMKESDLDFRTRSVVSAGSQGYNIATGYCTSRSITQLEITHNGSVIEVMKGKHKGEVIAPPSPQHDIAILERIRDQSTGTTFLLAAGLGVVGTMGAVRYLIDHWQELRRTYRNADFALALQFGPVNTLPLDTLMKGSVVRHFPESSAT